MFKGIVFTASMFFAIVFFGMILPLLLTLFICLIAEEAFHVHLSFWLTLGVVWILTIMFGRK